jgi:hypothetical protein
MAVQFCVRLPLDDSGLSHNFGAVNCKHMGRIDKSSRRVLTTFKCIKTAVVFTGLSRTFSYVKHPILCFMCVKVNFNI